MRPLLCVLLLTRAARAALPQFQDWSGITAMRYAASASPMLLRLKLRSFMECGADISFLSAFPAESEVVYPPMTFILPECQREVEGITVIDAVVTVG